MKCELNTAYFRRYLYGICVPLFLVWLPCSIGASEIDVSKLVSAIAPGIAKSGKRTAVVDFVDPKGEPVEFGRPLADEISIGLATSGCKIVDRNHIRQVLGEIRLSEKGLITAATAMHAAQLIGADLLVTGTVTPFSGTVHVAVMVVSVEDGSVVAGATIDLPRTPAVDQLLENRVAAHERAAPPNTPTGTLSPVPANEAKEGSVWPRVKAQLIASDGDRYFEEALKNAILPRLRGVVVEGRPSCRSREILVYIPKDGQNEELPAEITVRLDAPLTGRPAEGSAISWVGVPSEFRRQPFMLTMEVEKSKTEVRTGPCAETGGRARAVVHADSATGRLVRSVVVAPKGADAVDDAPMLASDPSMTWVPARSHSVRGTVTDEDGNPVAGAVVELRNDDSKQILSYLTNEDGAYRFENLAPATGYGIWATFYGKHPGGGGLFSTSVAPRESVINFKF